MVLFISCINKLPFYISFVPLLWGRGKGKSSEFLNFLWGREREEADKLFTFHQWTSRVIESNFDYCVTTPNSARHNEKLNFPLSFSHRSERASPNPPLWLHSPNGREKTFLPLQTKEKPKKEKFVSLCSRKMLMNDWKNISRSGLCRETFAEGKNRGGNQDGLALSWCAWGGKMLATRKEGFNVSLPSRSRGIQTLHNCYVFRATRATLNEFRGSFFNSDFLTLFP